MRNFITVLIFLPFLLGCQAKANKVKELCDSYNDQVPLVMDESLILTRVICDNTFFSFNYELKGTNFTEEQVIVLKVLFEKTLPQQLMNFPNLNH